MANATDTTKPATDADQTPTLELALDLPRNSDEVRDALDKAYDNLSKTAQTLTVLHEEDVDIVEAAAKGKEAKDLLTQLWDKKTIKVRELAEVTKLVAEAMQLTTALAVASRQYTDQEVGKLRDETRQGIIDLREETRGALHDVFDGMKVLALGHADHEERITRLEGSAGTIWGSIGGGIIAAVIWLLLGFNNDEPVKQVVFTIIAGLVGFFGTMALISRFTSRRRKSTQENAEEGETIEVAPTTKHSLPQSAAPDNNRKAVGAHADSPQQKKE